MNTRSSWGAGFLLVFSLVWAPGGEAADRREAVLDLGTMDINVERWSYEQEMSARIIREAYGVPYSDDPADRDQLRCWVEDRGLSKFGYLYCARMGDIKARSPSEMFDRSKLRGQGYGEFLVSSLPVKRTLLEQILDELSGDDEFNREFVDQIVEGNRPPRYFPRPEEIDQYLRMTEALEALGPDASFDQRRELARTHGLVLDRYEDISRMIQLFPSVSAAVAARQPSQGLRSQPGTFEGFAQLASIH